MKVSLLVLMLASCAFSTSLISEDEVRKLFVKYIRKEFTSADKRHMYDVVEILQQSRHLTRDSRESQVGSRRSIDCILCRSVFAALFAAVADNQDEHDITDGITNLCVILQIATYNVCKGAVALNMPVLVHIIRNTPEASPDTFCSLIQQSNINNNICPLTDPRFEWTVELPDQPAVPPTTNSSTSTSFKIALISDAHLDPFYLPNGVADCDEPTCCRKGQSPRVSFTYTSNFDDELLKDSVLERDGKSYLDLDTAGNIRKARMNGQTRYMAPRNSPPAGYWGDYRSCDSPIWAFENVIDEVSRKDAEIVYYVGDTIDHHMWETNYDMITEMNDLLIDKMRASFGPDVPIIPVIGNHESQPTNQFAPSSVTGAGINTTWLYESLARKWQYYLPEDALESLRERGAFTVLVKPGLRVVSINNNVAYRYNWWLVYDPQQQKRHLDWLVEQLHSAELAGERVHLLAHIPAGVNDLTHVWTREYNRVINRYASTIVAEFNGHTHSDELKVYYSDDLEPSLVAWGAGSATSYSNYNLNYKILEVDTGNFAINNIRNYVYNLTEANLTPHRPPHWFELYNFQHRFRTVDLTPTSIHNLIYSMVTTQKQLLDLYAAFYYKLSDTRPPHNNSEWKLNDLCKTVVTVLWERQRCDELRSLYYNTTSS